MKLLNRRTFIAIGLALMSGAASAQAYPNKPVKIVVAYAPGGTPDVVARTLAERLTLLLGQSFVVENKPGAGGLVAAAMVSKAAPDGYTLYMADIGQLGITPHVAAGKSSDPVKEFAPISMAAVTPMFIFSNAKTTKIKTLQQLISEAKASPGKLNYGSAGIGSIHHVAMEVFKGRSGINVTHVPYKGSGQSVPALLGGEVQILVAALPAVAPFVQSGQVNVLAVTSAVRYPGTPDVPTVAEFYSNYDYPSEIGLMAPAGIPADIVKRVSDAMKIALDSPEVMTRFKTLGAIPAWSSPKALSDSLVRNIEKYGDAVKISGVKFE